MPNKSAIPAVGRRAALRSILAAGAAVAAPVALAAPARSPALAAGIEAHKAAQAIVDGSHEPDADAFAVLVKAADEALEVVAEAPCASDADFFAKASYLIACERHVSGALLDNGEPFGLLAWATEQHVASRSGA